MKRLFLALKIHPDKHFSLEFEALKHSLDHESIHWVALHNLHITLKFLGETEENSIPGILKTVTAIANNTTPFIVNLHHLGIFGSQYAPKIIWIGINPYHHLTQLMKTINQNLEIVGFKPEQQNLVPHLTLGRIKQLKDKILFHHLCNQFREITTEPKDVTEITLFESILKKEGPEYVSLHEFKLKNPPFH